MNYLSHYYLDRNHPSPYYKLGLIFPEFFRGFNQKLRKAVFHHQNLELPEHQQLLAGIKRHYEVDKKFHSSHYFERYTGEIKTDLLTADLPSLRYRTYFLAHVLFEMLLDRHLITKNEALLPQFYTDLMQPDDELIRQYFIIIEKEDLVADFFVFFNRFRLSEYLYYYADNEKFVEALMRVYSQIHPVQLDIEENNTLIHVTQTIENTYSSIMQDVFGYMLSN